MDGHRHRLEASLRKVLIACLAGAATLWAAPSFASSFDLTGVEGGVMGGVYTSPYIATIDNQTGVLVICDDFTTDSYLNQTFTANASLVSDLTGSTPSTAVKFDNTNATQQQADYATAAYLAQEIIAQDLSGSPSNYTLGILSYALWGVFDPSLLTSSNGQGTSSCSLPYGCLTSQQLADAQSALNTAIANAGSTSQYSNVSIYTPNPKSASQEFLVVKTPEPSTILMLGLGLAAIVFFGRRRQARSLAAI